MTKKHVDARRARNAEITRIDRANRCDACKRELGPAALRFEGGSKFCGWECKQDFLEARDMDALRGR